jgi:hypothetical protein
VARSTLTGQNLLRHTGAGMSDDASGVMPVVRTLTVIGASFLAVGVVTGAALCATAERPLGIAVIVLAGAAAWCAFVLMKGRNRRSDEELAALAPPPDGSNGPRRRQLAQPLVAPAAFIGLTAASLWLLGELVAVLPAMALGHGVAELARARRFAVWERAHCSRLLAARGDARNRATWYAAPVGVTGRRSH